MRNCRSIGDSMPVAIRKDQMEKFLRSHVNLLQYLVGALDELSLSRRNNSIQELIYLSKASAMADNIQAYCSTRMKEVNDSLEENRTRFATQADQR